VPHAARAEGLEALVIQYVWEFLPKKEKIAEFERYYSGSGAWAALFAKSPGHRGTVLLRDAEQPSRYVTIDSWDSSELYQTMRKNFASEFEQLDRTCEAFTDSERRIGAFEVL
jgi:heme-degrading monooxygenase HmoA